MSTPGYQTIQADLLWILHDSGVCGRVQNHSQQHLLSSPCCCPCGLCLLVVWFILPFLVASVVVLFLFQDLSVVVVFPFFTWQAFCLHVLLCYSSSPFLPPLFLPLSLSMSSLTVASLPSPSVSPLSPFLSLLSHSSLLSLFLSLSHSLSLALPLSPPFLFSFYFSFSFSLPPLILVVSLLITLSLLCPSP